MNLIEQAVRARDGLQLVQLQDTYAGIAVDLLLAGQVDEAVGCARNSRAAEDANRQLNGLPPRAPG